MVIRDCPTRMMRSYLIWSISPFAPPTIPSFPRPPAMAPAEIERDTLHIYIVPVSRLEGRTDAEDGEGQRESEQSQRERASARTCPVALSSARRKRSFFSGLQFNKLRGGSQRGGRSKQSKQTSKQAPSAYWPSSRAGPPRHIWSRESRHAEEEGTHRACDVMTA